MFKHQCTLPLVSLAQPMSESPVACSTRQSFYSSTSILSGSEIRLHPSFSSEVKRSRHVMTSQYMFSLYLPESHAKYSIPPNVHNSVHGVRFL